jgi:ArsR family transcriptional regulator
MRELLAISSALSDENRLRALAALSRAGGGELCVCQIIELLDLAPSTVSKHLSILRQAGLIDARKDGRWMYYRLAGGDAPRPVREALAWLGRCFGGDKRIIEDGRRLKVIQRIDPEVLCCQQRQGIPCCPPDERKQVQHAQR